MHQRYRLFATSILLLAAFLSSEANAVNTFNQRAAWESAAGAPESIDFSTDDNGNPITNPPATVPFSSLTIKGVTFMNGVSYDNDFIYAPQGAVMRANLPPNTRAFGVDWFMYEFPGLTTFRLSTGEVFHPMPESIPYALGPNFFGVTSEQPIAWVEFSLTSTDLYINEFLFVAQPMQVAIDIKPGSSANPVNPFSDGVIPVALLSGAGFSAGSVDWHSLRFGRTGTEAPLAGYSNADVNRDGLPDLLLHFRTADSGITCGAGTGVLSGKTVTGERFTGTDVIRTVGCVPR